MADPLEGAVRVSEDPLENAVPVGEEDTFGGAIGRSAKNIVMAPYEMGRQLFGELVQAGRNLSQAKDVELRSLLDPRIAGPAAVQTVKDVASPIANSLPEIVGGTLGGVAGGPAGAVGGATVARGMTSLGQGKSAPGVTEDILTTLGVAGATSAAPVVGRYAVKTPGRYLSMPAERHAAGAAMMERVPERFGVTDSDVNAAYGTAERLAAQPPVGTAPLSSLTNAVSRMTAQASKNPITAIQDKALVNTLTQMQTELGSINQFNAGQVDAIVKGINQKIGSTTGAERGMWKQMLGSVHEDMIAAAKSTKDPAFQSYADAIRAARLNFLRQDIQDAIEHAGIVTQRTGQSVITSPGKIEQWMKTNPEWTAAVEKARPGLLDSIRQDIADIVPVTDVVGRAIPGQRFGSGRLALGGSVGVILSKLIGISPETAASVGAILGGVSPQMGVKMPPGYVERSFRPTNRSGSVAGAVGGGVAAQSQRQTDADLLDLLKGRR